MNAVSLYALSLSLYTPFLKLIFRCSRLFALFPPLQLCSRSKSGAIFKLKSISREPQATTSLSKHAFRRRKSHSNCLSVLFHSFCPRPGMRKADRCLLSRPTPRSLRSAVSPLPSQLLRSRVPTSSMSRAVTDSKLSVSRISPVDHLVMIHPRVLTH